LINSDDRIDTYYSRTLGTVPSYPAFSGNIDCDVCVIGGGLAGLNTALGLAERGKKAVVLEARQIGWGASGRNGGFVLRGFDAGDTDLPRGLTQKQKQRMMRGTLMAQELIRTRAQKYNIHCDITPGSLAVTWGQNAEDLRREVDFANNEFGLDLAFWDRDAVYAHCRTNQYQAGIFSPNDFHFHPLRYTHGIATAFVKNGGTIYEDSKALRIRPAGKGWRVETDRGAVTAQHVVVCTSVYGPGLDRHLDLVTFPVQTYVTVTKPVAPADLMQTINTPYCVSDLRFACDYYRILPDHRLLWGGRAGLGKNPIEISRLMLNDMFRVYPYLRNKVEADISWEGLQSYTTHRMPVIGQHKPGYWHNTGFGGHGMVPTTCGGELIAQAIVDGNADYLDFSRYGSMFTGGPLGPHIAMLVYNWWRFCDWLRYPLK